MKSLKDMTIAILKGMDHSEQSLAKLVGTSQPTIHRIRTGRTKNPGYTVGVAIENLYSQLPKDEKSVA
jgi:predicted transcriptional regulator